LIALESYEYAKSISSYYAYWDFDERIDVDNDATAHKVWKWLGDQKVLDTVRTLDEKWRREELLHLAVADYFSMFEPIFKTKD
jgi:hypothetical protein